MELGIETMLCSCLILTLLFIACDILGVDGEWLIRARFEIMIDITASLLAP